MSNQPSQVPAPAVRRGERYRDGANGEDPECGPDLARASFDACPGADDTGCAGIESLSLDLIFALPATLGRDWDADLRRALDEAPVASR